jgi:hypothetical protein
MGRSWIESVPVGPLGGLSVAAGAPKVPKLFRSKRPAQRELPLSPFTAAERGRPIH